MKTNKVNHPKAIIVRKYPIPQVGDKFGEWTVIDNSLRPIFKDNKRCQNGLGITIQCSCGYIANETPMYLHTHKNKCKVCRLKDQSDSNFKGVGELSSTYVSTLKGGAVKRGLEWNLSLDQLWTLFNTQQKKCALTDMPLFLSRSYCRENENRIRQTASLDRIDSSKGYIEGNVQWVHKHINRMKSDFRQEQFIDYCRAIIQKYDNENVSRTRIVARLEIEGVHRWLACPIPEVNYLKNYHRHIFKISAYSYVQHDNRDIEFIQLSHQIKQHLHNRYYSDHYQCLFFDDMSCEMIAAEIVKHFNLHECEVNEDGEGGAIVKNI